MIEHEIQAFGERLGLPELALNDEGRAGLRVGAVGYVGLERNERPGSPDEILLVLSRELAGSGAAPFGVLLDRTSWRRNPPFAAQASLFRDSLMLTIRMPEETVTAALLENALRYLTDEMNRAVKVADR